MFAWSSYLDLAKTLAGSKDEASQRSAISRAYYTIFHAAKILVELINNDKVPANGGSHQIVWRDLEKAGRGCAKIGTRGKRLLGTRREADYENEMKDLEILTAHVLKETEELLELVRKETAAKSK